MRLVLLLLALTFCGCKAGTLAASTMDSTQVIELLEQKTVCRGTGWRGVYKA